MAEIRHLENRHDVIFLLWSDLDKISQTGANDMSTAVIWSKSKPGMAGVWGNSMACHLKATCHIAGSMSL